MLPVDAIFSQLQSRLVSSNRVILQAPPGAGKSTRLPLLLLQSGQYSPSSQIIILEPRRVAARQIAGYLAQQLHESIGATIGLSMRGEHKVSAQTVITIVTDGVMVKKLQNDPELQGIALVIFDEFHERALQTDLALALSIDAQALNETIKLLIMSATIDLETLSKELQAPVVRSEGRQFPVEVTYFPSSLTPTFDEIVKCILHAAAKHRSSILVFLAGINDITKVAGLLQPHLNDDTDCFQLHGRLSLEEQNRAIASCPEGKRKIVLATNVAQTSLTIDGVDVVIDAGYEKQVYCQPKSGIEQLISQPISLASAEQRAGRAGRLRPGFCYRLASKESFLRRRQFDVAEIERVSLAQLVLEVYLWGTTVTELFWLTPPDTNSVERARKLLKSLGYMDFNGSKWQLTPFAKQFQQVNADLRGYRMMQFSKQLAHQNPDYHWVATACIIAALLEERVLMQTGDLHRLLIGLGTAQWSVILKQANKFGANLGLTKITKADLEEDLIGVLLALAFPDQIAKKTAKRWKLSGGSAVEFHGRAIEPNAPLIVVASINASSFGNYVGQFNPVELKDLETYCPNLIEQANELTWSDAKQKPTKLAQTRIGELVLTSTPVAVDLNAHEWQALWIHYIATHGLGVLGWDSEHIVCLRNRMRLAAKYSRLEDWPDWSESALLGSVDSWLAPFLNDVKSLKQLKGIGLDKTLLTTLDWPQQQELQGLCPVKYLTPAGHLRPLDYSGDIPKLSVKLQEMFGTPTNPAICNGQQPLLIELLSPAKRPLQVTQDLNHFWKNAYQEVKKEMKGRYPKHPWPNEPTEFQATSQVKSRL